MYYYPRLFYDLHYTHIAQEHRCNMRTTNQVSKGKPTGIARTREQVTQDSTPIKFGQYRGKTWDYVAEINPQYIVWTHSEIKNRNAVDLASMPLANWCGYVERKVQSTPQPAAQDSDEGSLDDMADDIPEDDVPF